MTSGMRFIRLPLSIFIAVFSLSAAIAQAADPQPALPSITEIRIFFDNGALSSPQADILLNGTRIKAADPDISYDDFWTELAQQMGYSSVSNTQQLYFTAFDRLRFFQALQAAPRPDAITAPSIFRDSAENIARYIREFNISTNPAIQADIARLRLIYDPTTSVAFTLAQRRAIEQLVLSRDPLTLLTPRHNLIVAAMNRRYGTIVTLNAFDTSLSEFKAIVINPTLLAGTSLTPEQLRSIETVRLATSRAPAIGARALTPEEQVYRVWLAETLPTMNLSPRDRGVLEYYWGIGTYQVPHTQTATAKDLMIDGRQIPRMTVNTIVNSPLTLPVVTPPIIINRPISPPNLPPPTGLLGR